ncbi:MAG: right-handed parallel beta-helix repeat-containing protein [Chitinivibrionales bacterium]
MKSFFAINFIMVLSVALLAPLTAHSTTIDVPGSGAHAISQAMLLAKAGDTILAGDGIYAEQVLIKSNVTLKARTLFKAIIDGKGKGCAVKLGGNATIYGFELRNATIGITSQTWENAIVRCRITGMRESGITCVGHLPKIEDNIIVFNKGSGIQGWDLQAIAGTTASSINHNTIAFNENNGIALEGKSVVAVENNIIAFNERSGLKLSKASEAAAIVQVTKNVFFENTVVSYIKLEDNFAFDPQFIEPRKMNFLLKSDSPCKNKGSDGDDLGARINQ